MSSLLMRDLLSILNESDIIYISNNKKQSVSVEELPPEIAQQLIINPRTPGIYKFSNANYTWTSTGQKVPMSFREAALNAARELMHQTGTQFARLIVTHAEFS